MSFFKKTKNADTTKVENVFKKRTGNTFTKLIKEVMPPTMLMKKILLTASVSLAGSQKQL